VISTRTRLPAGVDEAAANERRECCLNCGAPVSGRFCSACGQRVVRAYPSMREMVGDAWEELSGYDGRFARTFRMLLRRPGALTVDVLEGRRARYVSPVRVYLVASVLYFLVAAATPNLRPVATVLPGKDRITIDLSSGGVADLPPELRQKALDTIERAPWFIKPMLRSAALDPSGFRAKVLQTLPRVMFVLVPVFASIVSLFYRRRPFSQHLILALHLHAAVFAVLAVGLLANFTGSLAVSNTARALFLLFVLVYGLLAFRTVYRESWSWTVLKSVGVVILYLLAGVAGLIIAIGWAAFN
jgi:hypothetical protein